MSHRSLRTDLALLSLVLPLWTGAAEGAAAALPPFVLDLATGGGREATLTATPGTEVPLTLLRTTTKAETIHLVLSPFISDQGEVAGVRLRVGNEIVTNRVQKLQVTEPVLFVALVVDDLPAAGKSTGTLVLVQGERDMLAFKITLTQPRAAALEVTPKPLAMSAAAGWGASPSTVKFALTEKTKLVAAPAITVRVDEASADVAAGRVRLSINGVALDPARPVSLGSLAISAAATAPMTLTVDAAPAGKHTASLRFLSDRSVDDDAAKLGVTIESSHLIRWAVLALLAALALSFLLTKVLVRFRDRLTMSTRIRDARTAWLAELPSVLPVVWVRDILDEAEKLNHRSWLASPPVIETRLKQIDLLLRMLERAHQVRGDILRRQLPEFIHRRANAALAAVVARLEATTLSDSRAEQLRKDFEALADWTTPGKLAKVYGDEVMGAIAALFCEIDLDRISDPGAREVMADLQQGIREDLATPPATLDDVQCLEGAYARLKLLWDRRAEREFIELVDRERRGETLDHLFDAADEAAWRRLQRPSPTIQLMRPRDVEPTAWMPLTFEVVPARVGVAQTWRFRHGLKYAWTFEITPPGGGTASTFTGASDEPFTVAYADRPGTLRASVSITYGSRPPLAAVPRALGITRSSDDRFTGKFEAAEVISFVAAGIVALVSGLWLFYVKQPTFGTVYDYMGLMAWGIGIDQGKNLVQLISSWSAAPPKTA